MSSLTAQVTLNWEVYHPKQKQWLPFGSAGTVQEFLWHTGELPDPFYGQNEALYQWIEQEQWLFRSQFFLEEKFYNAQTLVLDIPNLDTYAQIFLNGKPLVQTANFFVHYQVELEVALLKCGYNQLEIRIEAPIQHHQQTSIKNGFTYPAPNDVGSLKVAPYTRKPQYHFGWDWAPRINTIGFAYPLTLSVKAPLRLDHLLVNTLALKQDGSAKVELKAKFSAKDSVLVFKSQYFGKFSISGSARFSSSSSSSTSSSIDSKIATPYYNFDLQQAQVLSEAQLWWPIGQGGQYLYHDTLMCYDEAGHLLLQQPFTFGIRTTQLIQEKDEWGTSFAFEINGRRIFAKGANVIPPGIFAGPALDSAYLGLVEQMQAANFNMVRIWGGGMYAPEIFLHACDKAGIMVWHDFMFACAMYPASSDFLSDLQPELQQHIPRLAAHPSLIYFNGNNEVDVAWKNWGFQTQYDLNVQQQELIAQSYQTLFQAFIPDQIKQFTNIPYEHTSPLSNWGTDDNFNHGTMHYWGVWHGKDPLHDFANKIGRFNAEYGFQSFPQMRTIDRFSPSKDQNLHSSIMKAHQKSYVGNGMIEKHAKIYFGKAKTFETFVYYSQLTQQKAVSMAIVGHRSAAPRCMGTIYWQLNDCWPAPTWSSLDDHNNWKALHYAVREEYRPIAVSELVKDDSHFLVLNSDLPEDTLVTIEIQFYNENGIQVSKERRTYPLEQNQTQVLTFIKDDYSGFVKVILDEQYERLFTFIDKRIAPQPQFTYQIKTTDPFAKKAVLNIETQTPLVDLWLFSKDQDLHFEQNFQTLLPGKHILEFTYETGLPTMSEIFYLLR
ncbi:MAG: glycosyl hydrolase 2 galactose-binding domain-containing protein [Flavobacteriales bacterium]